MKELDEEVTRILQVLTEKLGGEAAVFVLLTPREGGKVDLSQCCVFAKETRLTPEIIAEALRETAEANEDSGMRSAVDQPFQ